MLYESIAKRRGRIVSILFCVVFFSPALFSLLSAGEPTPAEPVTKPAAERTETGSDESTATQSTATQSTGMEPTITEPVATEPVATEPTGKETRDSADVLFREYQEKLKKLAAKCEELDLALPAKVTKNLLWKDEPYGFTLLRLLKDRQPGTLPADATEYQQSWYRALTKLRKTYSEAIYAKAIEAAKNRQGYDAFGMILNVLYIDPDHEQARATFGFLPYKGQWRSAWEIRQLERGMVDHPRFGWLKKEEVPQYESGKRPFRGEWLSEADALARIKSVKSAWRVETEHYILRTTGPIEDAVQVGHTLEAYYLCWQQLFYRFMGSDKVWASIVEGGSKMPPRRFKVVFFRNRAEYIENLNKREQNIETSYGGYFPGEESIFIYRPSAKEENYMDILLVHEATHQYFQECRPALSGAQRKKNRAVPGNKANFWVTEALSNYMETLRPAENVFKVGGVRSLRFQRAKERCAENDGVLAFRDYCSMSIDEFQRFPDIAMLYTQSAGMAAFFLHYDNGRYRGAFIYYLYLVYEGLDTTRTLEQLVGKSYETLEREYRLFMLECPAVDPEY